MNENRFNDDLHQCNFCIELIDFFLKNNNINATNFKTGKEYFFHTTFIHQNGLTSQNGKMKNSKCV